MARNHVLVVGGSGYLGQFLIAGLSQQFHITYTYGNNRLQGAAEGSAQAAKVDCSTGEGMAALFEGQIFHAVINCAAVSQPGVCEKDPISARSINIPTHLLAQLQLQLERSGVGALLLHISTDQVYDGTHALWTEGQTCHPVNVYGSSKLEAEHAIQASWQHYVILRSSIIYGPPPPQAVSRALFLQFVESALRDSKPTSFFDDEWRSPIYVEDIVRVCSKLLSMTPLPEERTYNIPKSQEQRIMETPGTPVMPPPTLSPEQPGNLREVNPLMGAPHNVATLLVSSYRGGPERLSRVDMAHKVAVARGFDSSCVISASASSVNRGVASPADISMDSSKLSKLLGSTPLAFSEALLLF